MKKKIAFVLFALALLLCLFPVSTAADMSGKCGDDLNWSFSSATGQFTITGSGAMYDYDSWDDQPWASIRYDITSVSLPNGLTSIGNYAFIWCGHLRSVTIPDSVTTIGSAAFEMCEDLKTITIPNSVTTIGGAAFRCSGLTSVYIPASVTYMANNAFTQCTDMTEIQVDPSNEAFSSANGMLLSHDGQILICCPGGIASATIPETVKEISEGAFASCKKITSIIIPNGVTSIGSNSFVYCYNLASVTIPDSVTTIGGYAFSDCESLTSITIPKGVDTIDDAAFANCVGLSSITIPNSVTEINPFTFENCGALQTVTFLGTDEQAAAVRVNIKEGNDCLLNANWTIVPPEEDRYLEINETNFPDNAFRNWIVENLAVSGDAIAGFYMTEAQVEQVTVIDVTEKGIASLKGIEHFSAMIQLLCSENQLTELDVSKNTALSWLSCGGNQLTELDVSQNEALTVLTCENNQLAALDVSRNTKLYHLHCVINQLTELDVSQNTVLVYLDCGANRLSELDVSQNTQLIGLACYYNQLSALDVSKNVALEYIYCNDNQLTALDVSENTALETLLCYNNRLASLDLKKNAALTTCETKNQQLPTQKLVQARNNYACDLSALLIDPARAAVTTAGATYNGAGVFTFADPVEIFVYTYDTGHGMMDVTVPTEIQKNQYLEINETNFPDNAFRNWIVENLAVSGDAATGYYMTEAQIAQVTVIDVTEKRIASLKGIEHFTAMTQLLCPGNQLTVLDVSRNERLVVLACENNRLTTLDVSKNTALEKLSCSNNRLVSLDLNKNKKITSCQLNGQEPPAQYLTMTGGRYSCDLSAILIDPTRVTVTTTNIAYDSTTGVFTFAKPVESFTYEYDTGHGMMEVVILTWRSWA